MNEVLRYLKRHHRVAVTAQTVRNWEQKGRQGVVLEGRTTDDIDAWVERFGRKAFGRGRPRK
jgi:transposase